MNPDDSKDLAKAIDFAVGWLDYSQCSISGRKVGACLDARFSPEDEWPNYFPGANIEFSTSFCVHAERVALIKAISEGYVFPKRIVITSSGNREPAAMCGYCRQDYMYVNPNIEVVIVSPKKEILLQTKLIDTLKYPYLSSSCKIK